MFKKIKKFFLNDKIILCLIIANTTIIFIQESIDNIFLLSIFDYIITLLFIIEMIVKISTWGFKSYIKSHWNKLDFVLVLLSVPSLITIFIPIGLESLSVLLVLRSFRLFKFMRIIKFFPQIDKISVGVKKGIEASYSILFGLFIFIFIFALICCALFKQVAPEFFETPLISIYSIFRLFTVEGWYEIPNTVINGMQSGISAHWIRLFFSILLFVGGIVGMSLLISVFVDAMVADNNDDLEEEIEKLHQKIDRLEEKIDELIEKK